MVDGYNFTTSSEVNFTVLNDSGNTNTTENNSTSNSDNSNKLDNGRSEAVANESIKTGNPLMLLLLAILCISFRRIIKKQ